ncbi:TPA: hypothetical protein GXZ34_01040 [bacterium]|nr:hypothetical protein [bacterium]
MNSYDGALTEHPEYVTSKYISVEPSQSYTNNYIARIVFFDEERNFINSYVNFVGTVESPENAQYMRVSIVSGLINNFQIQKGTLTPKEDFSVKMPSLKLTENNFEEKTIPITSLKDVKIGKNLFDKDKAVTHGRVSPTSGGVNTEPQNLVCRVSDYIEIEEGKWYSKNKPATYAFYDAFKTFIPVTYDGTTHGSDVNSFPAPTGAKYIRLSPHWYDLDEFQFEQNSRPTSYEKFGYVIDKLLIKTNNLPTKYPVPAIVSEEIYRVGNTKSVSYVDNNGVIWATTSFNKVESSEDGKNFTVVFDVTPYLNDGETISLHALYVSDTGRIICSTNQGRTLVSDEERTTMFEAFKFKAGITYINRGHCKYGKYIFMSSYGEKGTDNPPREVYMSADHGETWQLIFDKPIGQMIDPYDYHIHDVAFDPYLSMVLVSIGDGANRQIHYSYDFGETWQNLFDESLYGVNNWAPIHPTSILCFPDGIAFGSDELPEGISWWSKPKGITNPEMKWEDISWVKTFGEKTGLIGTYAMKGDTLHTRDGFYGVMPFRNHNTVTQGNPRLFVTGDGGRSWHEIFKEIYWDDQHRGFMNALLKKENGSVYIYAIYSQLGLVYIFKAEMPKFYEI